MISEKYHQTRTQIRDDGKLIAAAKEDPRKFEPLYTKYYPQILEFVYKRLDDVQEAYDVTANVFLRALEKLDKYEHRGLPFSAWLFRVAINELNQHFRKSKKFRAINVESNEVMLLLREDEVAYDQEDLDKAVECMKRLSSRDYLMLEMRYFEGRPFKEIGLIMEITENNAKVRTYRALDRLKRIYKR